MKRRLQFHASIIEHLKSALHCCAQFNLVNEVHLNVKGFDDRIGDGHSWIVETKIVDANDTIANCQWGNLKMSDINKNVNKSRSLMKTYRKCLIVALEIDVDAVLR